MATNGDDSSFIPSSNVDADESSPLLQRTSTNARALRARSSSWSSPSPSPTLGSESTENSLNKAQLTMVCFMRLMDPINFSQLFPYINEYVAFLGIVSEVEQVGFYSGLVDSVFAAAQLLLIYQWSSWSDRIGRRPIILAGSVGLAMSTIWFGASSSFLELMISRALAGVFGGGISVVQTVLGELTTKENQATAFAWYGVMWPLGSILGPLIGGVFSDPAERFQLFHDNTIFKRHPYLLPCLVCGILQLLATLMIYLGVEETLPAKRSIERRGKGRRSPSEPESCSNGCEELRTDTHQPNLGFKDLLSIPIIRDLTLCGFSLDVNGTSFAIVFALFCYSPIEHGGLAFPPTTIGYIFASSGIVGGLTQVMVLPPLLRRFEAANVFTASMACWPCAFAVLPFLNAIAVYGKDDAGKLDSTYVAYLWIGISLAVILTRLGGMSYSLLMLLTKENVPNPTVLGSTNGLVQCSMCLARCISAIASSAAFAYSQKQHVLGGYFWAVLLVFFGILGVFSSSKASSHGRSTL